MTPRRFGPTIVCAALLVLLSGCAQTDAAAGTQDSSTAASALPAGAGSAGSAPAEPDPTGTGPKGTAPSQASLEGIPLAEMTNQPAPVQMTQCLTQQAKWIELPAGKTSPDLYTRISAHEQELLFLLPDEVGGFDNVNVAAGPGARGTVTVFVVGSVDAGDEAATQWRALRDASPEVEAAAAGIESEGASFSPVLVDFSYAELCTTQLAALALPAWTSSESGLQSVRMDVETNRLVATVLSGVITSEGIDEITATGPQGIYDFEEVQ